MIGRFNHLLAQSFNPVSLSTCSVCLGGVVADLEFTTPPESGESFCSASGLASLISWGMSHGMAFPRLRGERRFEDFYSAFFEIIERSDYEQCALVHLWGKNRP